MPPSGFLAPGAGCTLTVDFTPKHERDVSASLQFLTPTGPLWLPIRCLARRALPALQVPADGVVEVGARGGGVMIAAGAERTVVITNAGALDVAYEIKVEGPLSATAEVSDGDSGGGGGGVDQEQLQQVEAERGTGSSPPSPLPQASVQQQACISVAGFKVHGMRGVVPGYGHTTFRVDFAPLVPGAVEVPLAVRFTAPAVKTLVIPTARMHLGGVGRELPVSAEKEVIDFK